MSEQGGQPDDSLNMSLKEGAARVRREDAGRVIVFAVENENIYPKQAEEIAAIIRAGIDGAERPAVLLDLTAVQFICSAFIGQLVELCKLSADKCGQLKLCVAGEHVAYTMKLVKINKIIEIAGDRHELLESFDG